ncbi:MAG: hypothetical protein K2H36_06655, partial [Clostridia bacterium]|nr:hypothetical protein [Clostridia bacterium]
LISFAPIGYPEIRLITSMYPLSPGALYSLDIGRLRARPKEFAIPSPVRSFVKKKKGNRAGATFLAKSNIPLNILSIYLCGFITRQSMKKQSIRDRGNALRALFVNVGISKYMSHPVIL